MKNLQRFQYQGLLKEGEEQTFDSEMAEQRSSAPSCSQKLTLHKKKKEISEEKKMQVLL